jgi:hypothetical protein
VVEGREQDFKDLKKDVGTNHSKNEAREREKEWGEQKFSELVIDHYNTDKINDGQECLDK